MTPPALQSDPACYVPHENDAILLDRVWQDDALCTRSSAVVRAGTPFCGEPDRWPSWMIIELMAQVVAASAGLREFRPGIRPRLGLLLGVRSFSCIRDGFEVGTRLELSARESTRTEIGMGVFDCTMTADGEPAADGILSVYLPEDVEAYLQSLES